MFYSEPGSLTVNGGETGNTKVKLLSFLEEMINVQKIMFDEFPISVALFITMTIIQLSPLNPETKKTLYQQDRWM